MRYLAILLVAALPANAYTPEELLSGREVGIKCDEKSKLCVVSEADLQWMMARDQLMNRLMEIASRQLKNCGVKGI